MYLALVWYKFLNVLSWLSPERCQDYESNLSLLVDFIPHKCPINELCWSQLPNDMSMDMLFNELFISLDPKYVTITLLLVQMTEQRLFTLSASLCTQTGLHCFTIQVLSTRVCFIDISYTPFTSVHRNLEHGLSIINREF